MLFALGSLARCLQQRLPAHHDALGIEAQHQKVLQARRCISRLRAGIESIEVLRSPLDQFLHLALANLGARIALDGIHGRVERPSRRFDRGHAPEPVRVPLLGQVQRRVEGAQALLASFPVRHPQHRHQSEHGQQSPGRISVMGSLDPVCAGNHRQRFLAGPT